MTELEHAMRWRPAVDPGPDPTPADRHVLERAFAEALAERERRRDAHREAIKRYAYRLGPQVGLGRITAAEAARRLDACAHRLDPTCPVPLFILPWWEAEQLAHVALAEAITTIREAVP